MNIIGHTPVFTRISSLIHASRMQLPQYREMASNREHLTAAIDWLCYSQNITDCGGTAATYNLLLGWEDAYPETTGYIIPTFYNYANQMDNGSVEARATVMAEWLVTLQQDNGGFPGGTAGEGDPSIFNTGQIVLGLVEAYNRTERDTFKKAAIDAADWLLEVQDNQGRWPNYDYKNNIHTYTTRVAWPLLEVAEIASKNVHEYRQAASANLQWATRNQQKNGWFQRASFDTGSKPYLHTIAYTIRGLLEGGQLLDDLSIINSARKSANKLLNMQTSEGILKGAYDSRWNGTWYYCLTGNAQMAVIWLRLYEFTGERKYLRAARHTIQFLKQHQSLTGPPQIKGGLPGSYPIIGRYMYFRYPNWSVKFFVDALLFHNAITIDDSTPEKENIYPD